MLAFFSLPDSLHWAQTARDSFSCYLQITRKLGHDPEISRWKQHVCMSSYAHNVQTEKKPQSRTNGQTDQKSVCLPLSVMHSDVTEQINQTFMSLFKYLNKIMKEQICTRLLTLCGQRESAPTPLFCFTCRPVFHDTGLLLCNKLIIPNGIIHKTYIIYNIIILFCEECK